MELSRNKRITSPKGGKDWELVKFSAFKVVDSCQTCSTKCSDTFRSFFVCGKEQESRKKYFITVQKKFTFLRGFDRKNKVFGISRNLIDRFVFK